MLGQDFQQTEGPRTADRVAGGPNYNTGHVKDVQPHTPHGSREEAVGLRRQVFLTLNEETVKIQESAGNRIKYGFEHVSVRIYK